MTDKHIRAWSAFLDSDADLLLCCEDDAVFKENSVQRVNDLIEMLAYRVGNGPIYVDLAGGCRYDEIKIDNLEVGRDDAFRFYAKPVTNTACAYLMNRPLVSTFHDILTRKPWLRLIGIDWLMNKLFITMAKSKVECACMHADPTIFKHGTTTGDYVAWDRTKS